MPEIVFTGTAGRLEGRYHHSGPDAPIALVLHPNPQFGGTMNSKVVYALYRCFADQGFNVLRFNFRGVGKSEGSFDNGEGELNDAASALDWLQTTNPRTPFSWVGGFSFGAWISMQLLMRRPEMDGFISISPPADRYEFTFLAPCPTSGLIIQGDQDAIVQPEAVTKLAQKLQMQRGIKVDYRMLKGADHFFTDHIPALCHNVNHYLKQRVIPTRMAG